MLQTLLSTSDASTAGLIAALEDITTKIELQPDYSIHHRDYQPLTLPSQMQERLQQLPGQLQTRFFSLLLRGFLYSIYYNGSLRQSMAREQDSAIETGANQIHNLENNTSQGVDLEFFNRLHSHNTGVGYYQSGWQVLREEKDGTLAVKGGDLTLHIERHIHLKPSQVNANPGDEIAVLMPSNLLQNGFYMAVGNAGKPVLAVNNDRIPIARIYFNLSPSGAIAIMNALTQQLNAIGVAFAFKALYNPEDYVRYDSGVLYFYKSDYQAIKQALQSIYTNNQQHFGSEVPLFTKMLAPGLGLAEEPDKKFSSQESFGLNRCQIVTNGLLKVWQQGDSSPEKRMSSILQQFSNLGLEWQRPYLNANSEDIYETFN